MIHRPVIALASLALAAAGLIACGERGMAAGDTGGGDARSWVLASAPADAQGVKDAKASAQEGESIVLRGRIGGRLEPITAGSPVFTVMDLAVPHCNQKHGDVCTTPWDYCCETPESLTANSATVQIVDASGRAVDESPDAAGFAPLDEVIVVGTVAARPTPDVLTIRATGLFRVMR
ncbi:MAG: hypothetical protein AAGI30_06815 [Planctomycetota bacterium]